MAAMKPRTGDGPLEATKEGRGIVMRVPLEGGGRLVVELTPDEAAALGDEPAQRPVLVASTDGELFAFHEDHRIVTEAWSPFAREATRMRLKT